MSTLKTTDSGMVLTDVPPSMAPTLNVVRGCTGRGEAIERGHGERCCVNGIRCAVIAPRVTSGAANGDQKAPAAEGLADDVVTARAIQSDVRIDLRRWGVIVNGFGRNVCDCSGCRRDEIGRLLKMCAVEMAHATQIAVALFTRVGYKEQRTAGDDTRTQEARRPGPTGRPVRCRYRQCRDRAGDCARCSTVIGVPGGKDRVEVRAEGNGGALLSRPAREASRLPAASLERVRPSGCRRCTKPVGARFAHERVVREWQ